VSFLNKSGIDMALNSDFFPRGGEQQGKTGERISKEETNNKRSGKDRSPEKIWK
jgi:hypothetical protein